MGPEGKGLPGLKVRHITLLQNIHEPEEGPKKKKKLAEADGNERICFILHSFHILYTVAIGL